MLKLTAVTAFMLFSLGGFAQFTISGTVQDFKTHRPLPGATIQVDGINRAAIAGDDGQFNLGAFTAGEYTLVIRHLGYTLRSEKVTLTEKTFITIALEESAIVTDEVVIRATRAGSNTPITQTTVNRQAIQKQNFGQDLPFLLNWTPSLVTTSDAGAGVGYTGLRIRGSDATRINVTINGIPYNDSESLGTFWVDVPDIASSSQSIQIQRGVGTSTNGAGAFGASINLQTNTRNDDAYGEVVNSAGSFGTRRHTASFGTGLLDNHWVLDGRVSKIVSDGFIDRASSDLSSYYFSGGFYAGKTMIKAIVFGGKERTYQSWYGVPESRLNSDTEAMEETAAVEGWNEDQTNNLFQSNPRTFNIYTYKDQVDDYRQDHYQLHFSHRINDALSANTSLHYTRGQGYYEEYKIDDDFENYGLSEVVIGNAVITSSDIVRRRWLDNDFYGVTYSFNYEKDKLSAVLGGAWNRYVGDHFGEITWAQISAVPTGYRYYFNQGDKHDFNSYLKINYQILEDLNAFVDLQYRGVTYTAAGIENKQNILNVDADYNFFNPKAGFTYSLSVNQQAYGSFSVGHREPVRDDFADNPGNTPKAETLHNVEVGYRKSGRFIFNLNYYLMNYRNQLVLTGAVNDVGASVRVNADKSYRMGIEAEGIYKISDALSWNVNLTLSKNKIQKFTEVLYDYGPDFDEYNVVTNEYKNTDISFSPNIIAGSGLSFFPFRGGEITLLSKYVGKQFLDNTSNNRRSIDAYVVNDIRVQYTWQPTFIKSIVFSFLVNNILDEEYESNGYTYGYFGGGQSYRQNYYFPQAGRNFMAMVSLKF